MWVSRVGQIEKRGVECRGPVNMQAPRGHGAGACTLWGSHYARSRQQLLSSSPLHILETPLDSLSFTSETCFFSTPAQNKRAFELKVKLKVNSTIYFVINTYRQGPILSFAHH